MSRLHSTAWRTSSSDCRSGPPIVADGGMGALLAGANPGLRCPEEANLRAPESVVAVHASYIRAGAELIETNTFGANRRKLAAKLLDHEFEAINSAAVRLAREAREVSGRDVLIAGAIGPLGELEVFDPGEHGPLYAEQAGVLEGRGVDLFMLETFFDLDELVSAVEAVRGVLVAADRGAPHLRRRRRSRGWGRGGDGGRAARAARRGGDRHESRRRPARGADRTRRDARRGPAARSAPEHRPREHRRRPRRLPALDPGVLRRLRCPGGRARRAHRRRLLRYDPGSDRGDPGGVRRGTRPCSPHSRHGSARSQERFRRSQERPSSPGRCARANGSSASSSIHPRAVRTTR